MPYENVKGSSDRRFGAGILRSLTPDGVQSPDMREAQTQQMNIAEDLNQVQLKARQGRDVQDHTTTHRAPGDD